MKEKDFLKQIETIKPGMEADQRIVNSVMNYNEDLSNITVIEQKSLIAQLKNRFTSMKTLPKVAAVMLLLSVVGTASAFATGHLVKSYPANFENLKDYEFVEDYEGGTLEPVSRTSIKGSEPIKNDLGFVDGYENIVGAAEEAFALLGLPNLIPAYLADNYYLDKDGYVYREDMFGSIEMKSIRAFFLSDPQYTKQVFLWVDPIPEGKSAQDIRLLREESLGAVTTTTYVTKSGLICTINKNEDPNHFLEALIMYDSDEIGNAMYRLEFSPGMEMDEVEAILESIPLSTN